MKNARKSKSDQAIDALNLAADVATAYFDLGRFDTMSEAELLEALRKSEQQQKPTSKPIVNLAAAPSNRGRPSSSRKRSPERHWLSAAASKSTQDSLRVARDAKLIERRAVRVDGKECRFLYKKKPFRVFLHGEVPTGVQAFVSSGNKWPICWSETDQAWCVLDIRLWQVDDLDSDLSWVK